MEESISQILKKIREDICDNYCRYRDTADEEMQCDITRNGGICPLERLD